MRCQVFSWFYLTSRDSVTVIFFLCAKFHPALTASFFGFHMAILKFQFSLNINSILTYSRVLRKNTLKERSGFLNGFSRIRWNYWVEFILNFHQKKNTVMVRRRVKNILIIIAECFFDWSQCMFLFAVSWNYIGVHLTCLQSIHHTNFTIFWPWKSSPGFVLTAVSTRLQAAFASRVWLRWF